MGTKLVGDHLSRGTKFDGDRLSRGTKLVGDHLSMGTKSGELEVWGSNGFEPNESQPTTPLFELNL